MSGSSTFEDLVLDWVSFQPEPDPRPPVWSLDGEGVAAELERIQRNRARETAREAELILRLAELRPDTDDPEPGTPGARRRTWRKTDLLRLPVPPPAEDLRPRLDLPHRARRHPAGDQPVRDHPHHPATRPATTRTRTTAGLTGRRPSTVLIWRLSVLDAG